MPQSALELGSIETHSNMLLHSSYCLILDECTIGMYCIEYWTTTLVIEGFIRANELCKQLYYRYRGIRALFKIEGFNKI